MISLIPVESQGSPICKLLTEGDLFNAPFKTRVVGAAAYLLLALMDHFEIDVGPPSSDLERPFEP